MEERLRQLSPSARSLVEAAAVIGPRVEPEVLEAVSGLSAAEFQAALGIAFGRRLLRDDPSTRGLAFGSEANRLAVSNLLAPTARQAIHRAAAKALADRGAPGSIVAEHRRQGGVDPARRVRVRLAVAGAALLVTAVVGWVGYRRATAAVVQPGTGILLADVRNQTADSGLGRAIYSAALVALQESPRVWILGRNQFPEILTRMRRVDTIVDGNLAREVAVRENLAVVAQVELAAIDSSFLITGRLIDAESGRDLEAANVRVAGRSGILPGVERLTATLRRSLGDVTRSTRRGDSLPRISTSSLAALVAFAEGDRAWIRGEWIRARDSWVRAVELDSAFALAYVSLAAFSFRMANAPADGRRYLALAERFADRLTERERLRLDLEIATREGHAERAVAIARTIAERYPTPGTLFGLGTTLLRNGRCPEATPVFERAVAMSPRFSNAWINLATCHNALGDLEPALAAYREAERADSTALIRDNINHEWGQVFLKAGRPTAAESAFQKILGHPEANQRARGYRSLGYLAMYQGRYREAAAALEQAIGLSRAAGVHVSLVRNLTIIANALISSGDVARAAERLDEGRRILAAQEFEAFYLESLGAGYLRLGRPGPAAELLLALGKQVRPTSLLDSAMYRRLAARIAVSRGRYREALGLLATAPPPSAPPTAAWDYLRGEAYLGLNLPDSALAAFQAARAIWNWGFEGQEEWVRASFRIGVVAEQLGNHDLARTAYSELIDRWQQGDSTIRELRAARQRLASLQTTPR
jgi:tetratricopeptide (TPR) repeat protein